MTVSETLALELCRVLGRPFPREERWFLVLPRPTVRLFSWLVRGSWATEHSTWGKLIKLLTDSYMYMYTSLNNRQAAATKCTDLLGPLTEWLSCILLSFSTRLYKALYADYVGHTGAH